MKKVFFILMVTSLFFVGCSYFKSNDELLTDKEWILYSRLTLTWQGEKRKSEWEFFKKSEEALVFKFTKSGDLIVKEDKNLKFASVKWSWKDEDKEDFILNTGRSSTEFTIHELDNNELTIFRSRKKDNDADIGDGTVFEKFKLVTDKTWTDEDIRRMKEVTQE